MSKAFPDVRQINVYDTDFGREVVPSGLLEQAQTLSDGLPMTIPMLVTGFDEENGEPIESTVQVANKDNPGARFLFDVMTYIARWKFENEHTTTKEDNETA